MTELRDQMIADLELAGYAPGTREHYIGAVRDLAEHFHRSPSRVSREQLRQYVTYLREDRQLGSARLRGRLADIKFLYAKTLGQPDMVSFFSWPSAPAPLPTVLSGEEVAALLNALDRPTYRMIATVMYATGMRISEACRLETADIDADRKVIHIRRGKGGEERLVPLTPRLLEMLRSYWKQRRPTLPYMFEAIQFQGRPVCAATVRRELRAAAKKAGLTKKVTPHILRHTCATHLLETGTDVRIIQAMLGHKSIRTTTRYTRVSANLLNRATALVELLPTS